MSIRFILEANDPETEALLMYLEGRFGAIDVHKRTVLKCALEWFEIKHQLPFSGPVPAKKLPEVLGHGRPPISS